MNILEKISKLRNIEKISIFGSVNLKRKVMNYIKNNINDSILFIEDKNDFSLITIDSREVFEEYILDKKDLNLSVIDMSIIADIYKTFPLIYIKFEEKMKFFLQTNEISMSMIRFVYADILKKAILENMSSFSFDNNKEQFQINGNMIRCAWPWYNMYIRGNTLEWCCGYTHTQEKQTWDETTNKLDIKKEWSSKPFQKVREVLSTQDDKGNCFSCHNLYFEQFFPYIFDFVKANKIQQENLDRVIYNYWMKNKAVDSYPVRYEIITSFKCNINCIMCNQEEYNKLKYELPISVILDNKEHFQKAMDISLLGGEFFAIKNAKEILKIFSSEEFNNVRFLFITNGTLIHRYFNELKNIQNMIISFSLDSIGENYEYIRQGAKWEKVEKNILDFVKLYENEKLKNPSINWQIQSPAIIMKSSLKNLFEYVSWCVEHKIEPAFIKLEPYGVNIDEEDIFRNKNLLDEVENWKDILESSLDLLKCNNLNHSYNTLNEIYKKLV